MLASILNSEQGTLKKDICNFRKKERKKEREREREREREMESRKEKILY
jgi:hypothetical protein